MPNVFKSGSLNLLETSGPVQACNGIGLPLPLHAEETEAEGVLVFQRNSLLGAIYIATRCHPQRFTKNNYWNFEIGGTAHVYDPHAVNIALAVGDRKHKRLF